MAADARIATGLAGHPKTKKLIRRLGPGAGWSLVCLILWAAANRSDGDLAGMTGEDIELAADWTGDLDAFVTALADVRFLDGADGAYRIHDWADHNPWVNGADMRSAKAKWNAVKRHHGEAEADRQVPEWASARNADSNAHSNAASKESDATSTADSKKRPSKEPASNQPSINFDAGSTEIDASSSGNDAGSNAPSPYPSPSSPSLRSGVAPTASTLEPAKPKKNGTTLRTYLDQCKAEGRKPLPPDHFIRRYCRDAGISDEMLQVAWIEFRDRFATGVDKAKLQKDWPAHFANAVKGRWAKLWFTNDRSEVEWTATGLQAKKVIETRLAQQAQAEEGEHAPA
ncbi:hypothetical protein J2W28_001024 [Variovorax boronicumulans]|uniref:hypothetical protein n=1 Tax=Variovorax boronicumulans TaxID=436515 RepID=UPI00277EA191|nr:hypothetical protein [Variovorax boronicumulans]MDP9991996.1 hypothetical protein [Variovorax boronicumulans]MDQ0001891.1 hypothetical protein [Variovorax boronicumulans]